MATSALDPVREINTANGDLISTSKDLLSLAGQVNDPDAQAQLRHAVSRLLEISGRIDSAVGGVLRRIA
jgi:hypothetical protein